MFKPSEEMIAAGLDVLDEANNWPDYPYTKEQMMEAILRNAMRFYVPPAAKVKEPSKREVAEVGFVYFVSDGEAIKIGKANDPKRRLGGIQTGTARPLSLLGVVPGGRRMERRIHREFQAHRLRGEWFADCAEIRSYISAKAKPVK